MITLKECEQIAKELDLPTEKVLEVLDRASEISAEKNSSFHEQLSAREDERLAIYKQEVEDARVHRKTIESLARDQTQALGRIGGLIETLVRKNG